MDGGEFSLCQHGQCLEQREAGTGDSVGAVGLAPSSDRGGDGSPSRDGGRLPAVSRHLGSLAGDYFSRLFLCPANVLARVCGTAASGGLDSTLLPKDPAPIGLMRGSSFSTSVPVGPIFPRSEKITASSTRQILLANVFRAT